MKKNDLDLSYLKDDELENTSSFVDLMSRSERKKRQESKLNKDQEELKEILFKESNKKVKNKKKDKKRKEQLNKIAKSEYDKPKVEKIDNTLYNTNRFKDFTDDVKETVYDNLEDNINIDNKKTTYGIGNILVNGIFIIASLVFYIYSILFTNIQSDETYLLIGGLIILGMIAMFCISIVSGKILYHILSILNYLTFIGYIIFNLLLVIGIKI